MSSAAIVIGTLSIKVKVSGYTIKGRNSGIYISASIHIWVKSKRKEFAPIGANSFLSEKTHFGRDLLPRKAKRKP